MRNAKAAAGERGRDARKTLRAFVRDEPADRQGYALADDLFLLAARCTFARPRGTLRASKLENVWFIWTGLQSPLSHSLQCHFFFSDLGRAKMRRPQEHSGYYFALRMRQSAVIMPNGAAACDISQRYRRIRYPSLRFACDSAVTVSRFRHDLFNCVITGWFCEHCASIKTDFQSDFTFAHATWPLQRAREAPTTTLNHVFLLNDIKQNSLESHICSFEQNDLLSAAFAAELNESNKMRSILLSRRKRSRAKMNN